MLKSDRLVVITFTHISGSFLLHIPIHVFYNSFKTDSMYIYLCLVLDLTTLVKPQNTDLVVRRLDKEKSFLKIVPFVFP